MSSRVLKKLHGDNDLEIKQPDEQLSDVENDIGSAGTKKKQLNINRYDLLNQQSPSESEVKEDDNETEHASAAGSNAHVCEKKKKKKRKKKSGKHSTQRRSSEDNADMDVITRTVREVNKLLGETYELPASPITTTSNSCPSKSLLSVQHKNLNSSHEMKRMFGSRVVQVEQSKRRNFRGQRPLKSTWIVNVKDNWPPVGKTGIYMNLTQPPEKTTASKSPTEKNILYFSFEHSPSYRQLQQKFLTAVESINSEKIVEIINQQPYHVDALIQLSELCKMSEDNAMASDLIERAILAMETCFHSLFSLTAGNCRLDYRRQENRSFFIVLFKHAQYLEARACSRTALEIAKLILTLDPINDPLAMILIIDYYAIRSKQYEWLLQLYNEWESVKNLSQLPNMAFSSALALFYLHKDNDCSEADKALQYALLMFPGILKPLLDELSIQVDSRVSSHNYFGPSAYTNQPIALQQLTSLYVCRSKLNWRDTEILPWLERNVNTVLDKVDAKDETVNEYALKRTQRYINPPRAILRHIVLSDFKEKVPLASFILKETDPILMYDPLPPLDSINIYNRPDISSTTRVSMNSSPFSMFFQSILPSFNVQQAGLLNNAANRNRDQLDNNVDGDDIEGAVGLATGMQSYAEFRNSLNSIVDAMRDFLSNIRVPERPNDADVDENESTDDEANDYLT